MFNFIKNRLSGGRSNKATQYDIQECLKKLTIGVLFCENLSLPVVDVHDIGTNSAKKNFSTCTSQKTYIEYGWSNLQLRKNEICPVSLHNTVIDQIHKQ